jgi:hypothetical protein
MIEGGTETDLETNLGRERERYIYNIVFNSFYTLQEMIWQGVYNCQDGQVHLARCPQRDASKKHGDLCALHSDALGPVGNTARMGPHSANQGVMTKNEEA